MHTVVIGSGIGGVTFAQELLNRDAQEKVSLLTYETHGYYSRPLLSHGFTRADIETKIVMRSFEALSEQGINIASGVEVMRLDAASATLVYREGDAEKTLAYDRLVLVTGSGALIPPPFVPQSDMFYVLNSLADLIRLRQLRAKIAAAGKTPRWAVVGGGLIGCELASDLSVAGDKVHLFHAMPRLMERQLVEEDSQALVVLLKESGISVTLDCAVNGFEVNSDSYAVVYDGGRSPDFDCVIVSCGFKPRIELAKQAGLAVGRGILVDDFLRTDKENIYALGDVAEFSDGKVYAYVTPIRNQAIWLAEFLAGNGSEAWMPPFFKPKAKVHGFEASYPYKF